MIIPTFVWVNAVIIGYLWVLTKGLESLALYRPTDSEEEAKELKDVKVEDD